MLCEDTCLKQLLCFRYTGIDPCDPFHVIYQPLSDTPQCKCFAHVVEFTQLHPDVIPTK